MNEMKEFQERGVQIEQQACRRRNKRVRFRFHPLLRLRNDGLDPRRESKPSRGMSEAKGEQESTETLSFRCDCERCRLTRGAVDIFKTKAAFTLAEVLITLGIIGIVAALTMPALITNIQDRIQAKRIENINQKLSKVTDKMAVQSGLTGYGTTMAFVQEMSKHMKIAKICDNEHLAECWPTQEVTLNDEGKTWEISKTKTAKTLKISNNAEDWADTVGIVTGDGTGMILSYNKKCEFSVDDGGLKYDNSTGKSNSLVCLSGVYDWNGSSKPNKLKKDVTMLGLASGLGTECAIELGGKCFTAPFTPTPLTEAECEAEKDKLGIKECLRPVHGRPLPDYWAGAVKQCGGVNKMPTRADLTELAKFLYNSSGIWTHSLTLDISKTHSLGIYSSDFYIMSMVEGGERRHFYSSGSTTVSGNRSGGPNDLAICIGD